jgi:hypothetical protein
LEAGTAVLQLLVFFAKLLVVLLNFLHLSLLGKNQDVLSTFLMELEKGTCSTNHTILIHIAELVILVILGQVISFE